MSLFLQCGTPIVKKDLIIINGTDEDIVKLTEQMKRRKEESKKGKKSKNHVVSEATSKDKLSVNNDKPSDDKPSKNKRHNIQDGNDKQHKKTKVTSDPKESKNKFEDTNSYKKLFHKNCEKKEKAHWVTYNPYYN